MYSRTIQGAAPRTCSFGVSGKLWRGVLVMYDRETDSLWTQLEGRALTGPLAGARLQHLPSVQTTWSKWKAAHPATLVLRKETQDAMVTESRYASYLADKETTFTPDLARNLAGVLPKTLVFGAVVDGRAVAVTEELLVRDGEAVLPVGDVRVRFERDAKSDEVRAWASRGSGAGEEPLRVDRALWYAWRAFHPRSLLLLR